MNRYGDVEHELQEIAHAQGSNVDEIVELVRINEETMDRMRVSRSTLYPPFHAL